jgi:phospholipid/cholesterol/gamma-HCH transport system substrate-binding protein
MASRKLEVQVGLTVVAAVGILLWGVTWLKELQLNREVKIWHVSFTQTGGLSSSDEVQVNGLRKGVVQSIQLVGDRVAVDLALSRDIVVTEDSRVAIRNVGLMGEKVIAVDLRMSGRPYTDRDTIPGVYELGMGEVMAGVGGSVDALNQLTTRLQGASEMLSPKGEFGQTMRNLRDTSKDLQMAVQENRAALKTTLDNFSSSSKTLKSLTVDREQQLRTAMDHFASAAQNLDLLTARLDSLRRVAQGMTAKVSRGEGTLGKLVNDDKLYTDASNAVQSLKALIEDIRSNPKKYVTVRIF